MQTAFIGRFLNLAGELTEEVLGGFGIVDAQSGPQFLFRRADFTNSFGIAFGAADGLTGTFFCGLMGCQA